MIKKRIAIAYRNTSIENYMDGEFFGFQYEFANFTSFNELKKYLHTEHIIVDDIRCEEFKENKWQLMNSVYNKNPEELEDYWENNYDD